MSNEEVKEIALLTMAIMGIIFMFHFILFKEIIDIIIMVINITAYNYNNSIYNIFFIFNI